MTPDPAWHDACAAAELEDGAALGRVVGGVPVALFRLGGEVFALHDRCPHGAARLSEGWVEDGCVECPLHAGTVDIRTGAPRTAPISEPVRVYPARVADGRVLVAVG